MRRTRRESHSLAAGADECFTLIKDSRHDTASYPVARHLAAGGAPAVGVIFQPCVVRGKNTLFDLQGASSE